MYSLIYIFYDFHYAATDNIWLYLGVVAEGSYDASGQMTLATTFSPNIDPQKGFRRKDNILQIGLTKREISKIDARLRRLLKRVENGEIQLF